jgi:hypothetical protein
VVSLWCSINKATTRIEGTNTVEDYLVDQAHYNNNNDAETALGGDGNIDTESLLEGGSLVGLFPNNICQPCAVLNDLSVLVLI